MDKKRKMTAYQNVGEGISMFARRFALFGGSKRPLGRDIA
jgi:hypothetical protein